VQRLHSSGKLLLIKLLNKDHLQRLGAGPDDNLEIRKHPWMQVIDFDKLLKYELPAPIVPQIQDDLDVDNFNAKYTSESTPCLTKDLK
jgi:hypothetical protein